MPYAHNGKQKPITERALKALEDATRAALEDAQAPADLAPQLVAIAIEYGVPGVILLSWIRTGKPSQITGAAWRKAARFAARAVQERRQP